MGRQRVGGGDDDDDWDPRGDGDADTDVDTGSDADSDGDSDADADSDVDADTDSDTDGDGDGPCPSDECCQGKACDDGFDCVDGSCEPEDPCDGDDCCAEDPCPFGFDCVGGFCEAEDPCGGDDCCVVVSAASTGCRVGRRSGLDALSSSPRSLNLKIRPRFSDSRLASASSFAAYHGVPTSPLRRPISLRWREGPPDGALDPSEVEVGTVPILVSTTDARFEAP